MIAEINYVSQYNLWNRVIGETTLISVLVAPSTCSLVYAISRYRSKISFVQLLPSQEQDQSKFCYISIFSRYRVVIV